jgi:hypothetical protein
MAGQTALAVCGACGSELLVPPPGKGGVGVVQCATCTIRLIYRSALHLSEEDILGPADDKLGPDASRTLVLSTGDSPALSAFVVGHGPPPDGIAACLRDGLPCLQLTDFALLDEKVRAAEDPGALFFARG